MSAELYFALQLKYTALDFFVSFELVMSLSKHQEKNERLDFSEFKF
jgi:hypothetical protein